MAAPARCATDFEITANISITNVPAGLTTNITVNIGTATTRNWTNDPSGAPSTGIRTTNTPAASVTNLILHFTSYPVYSVAATGPRALFAYSTNSAAVTNFTITAPRNTNLTVTFGGGWASLTYSTQFFAGAVPILNQTNAMSAEARTNAANAIVNFLGATNMVSSNAIPPGAKFLQHYTDNTSSQSASNKTLIGPILSGGAWLNATNLTGTNVNLTNIVLRFLAASGITSLDGFLGALTNGTLYSNWIRYARLDGVVATNFINYGNSIRSEGPGGNSLQVGSNATALSLRAMAIGNGSIATNTDALAIGTGAIATNTSAVSIGNGAVADGALAIALGGSGTTARGDASIAIGSTTTSTAGSTAIGTGAGTGGTNSIAIGNEAITTADAYNATAIGNEAQVSAAHSFALGFQTAATHSNSVALGTIDHLGNATSTTDTNQIRIGTANHNVSIPGVLIVSGSQTNHITTGTNRFNARLDFTARNNTSLANGYNSGVILGSNVYVRLSGPSGAYTNAGWAAEVDGSYHILEFDNPVANLTILDNSGLDATAANRITTGTGALVNYTNNPVIIGVIYNATAARWRLIRTMPTP